MPRNSQTLEEIKRFCATLSFFRTEYRKRTAWLVQNATFMDCIKSYTHVCDLFSTTDEITSRIFGAAQKHINDSFDLFCMTEEMASEIFGVDEDYVDASIEKILDGIQYITSGHQSTLHEDIESYTILATERMWKIDKNIKDHLNKLLEMSLNYGVAAPYIFNLESHDELIQKLIIDPNAVTLRQNCYGFPRLFNTHTPSVQWFTSEMLARHVKFLGNSESLFFSNKLILAVDYLSENLNIDECLEVIRGHIIEKRTSQTMIKLMQSEKPLKDKVTEDTTTSYFDFVKHNLHHSFDIERIIARFIGLAMWDRVHVRNIPPQKAFRELIDSQVIFGCRKQCEAIETIMKEAKDNYQNKCIECERHIVGRNGCFKQVNDYYIATDQCIKLGEVLSLVPRDNKKKWSEALKRAEDKIKHTQN